MSANPSVPIIILFAIGFGFAALCLAAFTLRMIADGERARDFAWPGGLAVVCTAVAVAAAMRARATAAAARTMRQP